MSTHTTETIVPQPQHVACALTALGNGFLAHPHNHALRDKLATGQLHVSEYYAQLRRLLYRLLFLLTAEAQGVLPSPQASPAARQRYLRSYSLSRLQRGALVQHAAVVLRQPASIATCGPSWSTWAATAVT